MQRNWFVVMRICSPVALSYLDARFEPRCCRKDVWISWLLLLAACCFPPLLLLKCVAPPWTLRRGQDSRLGPSWVLVFLNALEITVEQSPLALQMFLHGQDDRHETWLKNSLFSPRNRPPRGTTAWHTPYSPPICILLMAQSLWKTNGPHWKHLRGTPTIVPRF